MPYLKKRRTGQIELPGQVDVRPAVDLEVRLAEAEMALRAVELAHKRQLQLIGAGMATVVLAVGVAIILAGIVHPGLFVVGVGLTVAALNYARVFFSSQQTDDEGQG